MANKPNKPAATGEAQAPEPEAAPTRQRAALSMEKRLAISLAAVLAAVKSVIDTKDGKAAFQAAKVDAKVFNDAATLADEVNQKTIKPIDDRLAALNTEIAEAAKVENLTADGGAQKLKDLTMEMTRLQARRKNLVAQAAA